MIHPPRVCIVDYGGGNQASVFNMLDVMHVQAVVSSEERELAEATHLVLPGVGAFGTVMTRLKDSGLLPLLERYVRRERKPFLGICVGMQILAEKGLEFGETAGLGWIPGTVEKMKTEGTVLPHMGWNSLTITQSCPLLDRIGTSFDFYFVHSYSFNAAHPQDVYATCAYGGEFAAVVRSQNIYGVQFHPEKSQKAGKVLLENFLNLS